MKKLLTIALVAAVGVALSLPYTRAAEDGGQVTQTELAKLLVNITGLNKGLSANPTATENFAALLANGIAPVGGWKGDQIVTRADLARVIVQSIGDAAEVGNPDDPASWIDYLKSIGVPIDTVGQAVGNVEMLPDGITANPAFGSTVDPINKPGPTKLPDTQQFGTDAVGPINLDITSSALVIVTPAEVIAVVTEVTQRKKVTSSEVTPDSVDMPPIYKRY